MTDATTIEAAEPVSPASAQPPEVGHQFGSFLVKTKQTLASIAEEIFGNSDPDTLHHIWDWNRNNVSSPGAGSTVPSGVALRIAQPGNKSGGPSADSLSNGTLTDASEAREVPGDAPVHTPGAERAVTRDMSPRGTEANAHGTGEGESGESGQGRSTVDEGSAGAEAQARQDAADLANAGKTAPAPAKAPAAAAKTAAKPGDADFTE